jgi:hypothetical protein
MKLPKPLAPLLLGLALSLGRADPPPSPGISPDALALDAVRASAATSGKGLGDWLFAQIDTYDFAINARKTWENLPEDPAFLESREFKEIDLEKQTPELVTETMLRFMAGGPKYPADTVAWLRLFFSPRSSWEQAYPLYQKIAEERPRDFIPKAFVLFRPVKTLAALPEWYSLFDDAYACAATPRERAFCLLILPAHVTAAADIPGGEAHLEKITAWLDNLEKHESAERLPALRDIGSIRFFVCTARRDYASAAAYAKPAGLKNLEPLLLVLAGKPDEAQAALKKLRRQPVLSEDDQRLLDHTATILRDSDATRQRTP